MQSRRYLLLWPASAISRLALAGWLSISAVFRARHPAASLMHFPQTQMLASIRQEALKSSVSEKVCLRLSPAGCS